MDALRGPARLYGQALAELASEESQLAAVIHDLEIAREAFSLRELGLFFGNPLVPRQAKLDLLDVIFAPWTTTTFLLFLRVVIVRRRERLIRDIILAALYECLAHNGTEVVFVTTSVPLDAEQEELVRQGLASALGVSIYPEFRVNPNLLGGLVVRRGEQVLDASVLGILRQIGESLAAVVIAEQG